MNGLSPSLIVIVVLAYFALLMLVSYFTGKDSGNENFFVAGRKSPWYLVAFGMVGASLSGVTFISVPGWVGGQQFSYMQMVYGYFFGYLFIMLVLMPVYYRLQLTSIYTYLEERFGFWSYKTGAGFFILSRTIGAAFRLYLVAMVFQFIFDMMPGVDIPFWVTVLMAIALIWVYTFRGGIKTIVWTDTLQTLVMLTAVILTVVAIGRDLGGNVVTLVAESDYSQIFFFEDGWSDGRNFFKRFLAGVSIAIVMTGLDQDMMQKNLSCKNIGDAQKNMFSFSIVLIFANLLFLGLGALLYMYMAKHGIDMPTRMVNGEAKDATDLIYPTVALQHLSPAVGITFIIGIVAAAYSSADSALASLTTSFCVDFLGFEKKDADAQSQKRTRNLVHLGFSALLFFVILAFWLVNDDAVISSIFKVAGYTYGPLLGLYIFGFFTNLKVKDSLVLPICIAAPILTYIINANSEAWFGYTFSFELLILNGVLTFLGLLIISKR